MESSNKRLIQTWLDLQCTMVQGTVRGAVLVGSGRTGTADPVAVWPADAMLTAPMLSAAHVALNDQRQVVEALALAAGSDIVMGCDVIATLSVSILFAAEWIGIVPNEQRGYIEGRRILCESLAVQLSSALTAGNVDLVSSTVKTLVERDSAVLSASVVAQDGRELVTMGPHSTQWGSRKSGRSTSTHVQVPIFEGDRPWGSVQVVFAELSASSIPYSFGVPLLPLMMFIMTAGFLAFLWFIKRTLKELDPSSVVPERVKSAFDRPGRRARDH